MASRASTTRPAGSRERHRLTDARLIELANTAEDERVRSVCLVAVLDRAGIRGMDYDPKEDEARERPKFNPRDYTPKELNVIEAALKLLVRPKPTADGEETGEGGAIGSPLPSRRGEELPVNLPRCQMGGVAFTVSRSPGAPKGTRNGRWRGGFYSQESVAERFTADAARHKM